VFFCFIKYYSINSDILTVGNRIKNRFLDMVPKLERFCIETASGSFCARAVRLSQENFILWNLGMSLQPKE